MSAANSLRARWAALPARQQQLALVIGALVALVLIITLVWLPLERSRTAALQRLPMLQAELQRVQQNAEEVKRLKGLPPSQSSTRAPDLNNLRNIFPGADISALDGGRWRVTLADARFSRWLDGVRALNGQLVIADINVSRTGDKLRLEAVLRPAGAAK